jgi:hypothetical protein
MPVGRVLIDTDVCHDDEVRVEGMDDSDCQRDGAIGVKGFGSAVILDFWNAEQKKRSYSRVPGLFENLRETVQGIPEYSGHRSDRFLLVRAPCDKQGENEVFGVKVDFADEIPDVSGPSQAAGAFKWMAHESFSIPEDRCCFSFYKS